jgi:hypothetical protein
LAETLRRLIERLYRLIQRLRQLAERRFPESKPPRVAKASRRTAALAPSTLYKREGSEFVSRARTIFRTARFTRIRRR